MDGEILINQAKVLAGQITPGDTPGFPVTISQPGSYRLSGNLTVPRGVNGIVITVSNVTIDLNGFQIAATSPGPGCGITDNDVALTGITIRNGTICAFGNWNVYLQHSQAVIEGLQIRSGENGIVAGPCSLVKDNIVSTLALFGIGVGANSIVIGNIISHCPGSALTAGSGSIVCNNSVSDNYAGISIDTGSVVKGNTAMRTTNGSGITVGANSTVIGNTASHNKIGISITSPCTVLGNTAVNNTQNMVLSGSGSTSAYNTAP